MNHHTFKKVNESVAAIQERTSFVPKVGLVLGSGLGPIADELEDPITLPYTEIPHFKPTHIAGHSGALVLGKLNGVPTACLKGRFHYYEGHSLEEVVHPTRVLGLLGIHTLLLTNAAGGINTRFRPGNLMVISDHLNLVGSNPLLGPNAPELGPRFPDLSEAYDSHCVKILIDAAKKLEIPIQTGVYAGLSGPSYETPAEVRMLRTLGADAVGMSTVAECIAARHMGIRVAGISCISNLAAGLSAHHLSHQEVLDVSKQAAAKMRELIIHTLPKFAEKAPVRAEAPVS